MSPTTRRHCVPKRIHTTASWRATSLPTLRAETNKGAWRIEENHHAAIGSTTSTSLGMSYFQPCVAIPARATRRLACLSCQSCLVSVRRLRVQGLPGVPCPSRFFLVSFFTPWLNLSCHHSKGC